MMLQEIKNEITNNKQHAEWTYNHSQVKRYVRFYLK